MRILRVTLAVLISQVYALNAGIGYVRRALNPTPGVYLVQLRQALPAAEVLSTATSLVQTYGGSIRRIAKDAWKGFSASLTPAQALALDGAPEVDFVEEVDQIFLSGTEPLPPNELWNLDRIDGHSPSAYDETYNYCERGGGVIVYVVDSGIRKTHVEIAGRVLYGVTFAADRSPLPGEADDYGTNPCGGNSDSYNGGHGTAVASIVAGATVGVAKNALLVPIRVLTCNGSGDTESLNWGLDWIKSSANPYRNLRPAVVTISTYRRTDVGDPLVTTGTTESVINGLVLDDASSGWRGIPVICSANNVNTDDNQTSPARMAYRNNAGFPSPGHVISVGGTAEDDLGGRALKKARLPKSMTPPQTARGFVKNSYLMAACSYAKPKSTSDQRTDRL